MSVLRSALLAGADSAWLRERATHSALVRRAVSRFMPGESLDDAMSAATALRTRGLATILTQLGENLTERAEADAVARHYLDVLERVRGAGLDAEISVKLTQLGLDLDAGMASAHLDRLLERARECGNRVWIDMESTAYTDRTLDAYRKARAGYANVGVALQTYLRRTAADVESLIPLGATIRLVKGAYREPAALAFPIKRDVDENYFALAGRLLSPEALAAGCRLTLGTHDGRLIERIQALATTRGVSRRQFEFALLYGIQRSEQLRLAEDGHAVRVLISYGSHWFQWYMRRLAERPANLLFVMRSALGG